MAVSGRRSPPAAIAVMMVPIPSATAVAMANNNAAANAGRGSNRADVGARGHAAGSHTGAYANWAYLDARARALCQSGSGSQQGCCQYYGSKSH
ncbi:MAG TPA: hypothetical protein VLC74_11370 [Rhizomicrobium sp.]|nr:hypothetical protein [Rhizomicrobium sp.]